MLVVGILPLTGDAIAVDDACSLLTQDQVSAVLGISVGAGQHIVPSNPKMCGWAVPGGPILTAKKVVLIINTTTAFTRGKTPITGITMTPVNDIGDDAYYVTASGPGTTLNVKKGSAAFSISVKGTGFSVEQVKQMEKTLAQDVLTKLGSATEGSSPGHRRGGAL
jgi:hypothetical protein